MDVFLVHNLAENGWKLREMGRYIAKGMGNKGKGLFPHMFGRRGRVKEQMYFGEHKTGILQPGGWFKKGLAALSKFFAHTKLKDSTPSSNPTSNI